MRFYLRNALGFFIQLYPCAVMVFLPFSPQTYRFRRKQVFTWMTVVAVVLAALFSAALHLRDSIGYPVQIFLSSLLMLAAILLVLAAYAWMVREKLIKKILVFAIVLFYAVSQFFLVNVLLPYLPWSTDLEGFTYSQNGLVLYAATTVLFLPLMLGMVIRPLGEYIQKIEPQNMRREFFSVVASTSIYLVLTLYCDTAYRIYGGIGETGIFQRYLLPLLLFLTLNQVLTYWLIFRESIRRKQDSERKRTIEIQQLQYDKITKEMENTRRIRHDMRHHLTSLHDMLAQGRAEEAKDYLSELVGVSTKRENETYCRNMIVNGLLQYYVGLAQDKKILCKVQAECGELTIDSTDLTVLFGNAMENAIHACQNYEGNRWITVRVGTIRGSLVIEITNPCREAHIRISGRHRPENGFLPADDFLSKRAGGGYGLRSLAHTAQKYGGDAQFRFDAAADTFTARIRLNLYAEMLE